MKTKEELNALKEEVDTLNRKIAELTEEELAQVSGGAYGLLPKDHYENIILSTADQGKASVETYEKERPYDRNAKVIF